MTAIAGNLAINLGLNTANFKNNLEKTEKSIGKFAFKTKRAFANMSKRILKSLSSAKVAIGALVGTVGLGALIKTSIESADKIGNLSERIGASTEALSQYQHVAELTGVTFQGLTTAWQRQTRRISEAVHGTGEAKNALIELGISAVSLKNLKPEEQFEVLAGALSKVENQSDKVRLAMKFWDTEGVSLLQTIAGGTESIKSMRAEADRLGKTLSKDQVAAAQKASAAITRMKTAFTGLGNALLVHVGPTIAAVANWFSEKLPQAIEFAKPAIKAIGKAFIEVSASFLTALAKTYAAITALLPKNSSLRQSYTDAAAEAGWAAVKLRSFGLAGFDAFKIVSGGAEDFAVKTGKAYKELNKLTYVEMPTLKIDDDAHVKLRAAYNKMFSFEPKDLDDSHVKILESHEKLMESIQNTVINGLATVASAYSSYTSVMASDALENFNNLQQLADAAKANGDANAGALQQQANASKKAAREAFETNKTAQKGSVIVNTASAIMRGYADLGPIAGSVAAAFLATAGGLQSASIDRQKFNSSSGGITSGGTPGGGASVPTTTSPITNISSQRGGGVTNLTVVLSGGRISSEDVEEVLLEIKNRLENGDEVYIEVDSHQAAVIRGDLAA